VVGKYQPKKPKSGISRDGYQIIKKVETAPSPFQSKAFAADQQNIHGLIQQTR
jgi:hypothetical protein